MAGVKPHEYLLGTGGFILLAGIIISLIFGAIGTFTTVELMKVLIAMSVNVVASILLGASIGLLAKNQQAATATAMPVAVILGFTPMIASFNGTIEKAASVLYTQQLNVILNDFAANFPKALVVMGINIAVLIVLFIIAYMKNGLKG